MSVNSIISDPEPFTSPATAPVKKEVDDWEKLAKDKDLPRVKAYLAGRKEHYRRYLPGGEPLETLDDAQRSAAWGQALCVIKEIEAIEGAIGIFDHD